MSVLPPTRVLVAEDDVRLLAAVSELLAGEPGLEVVAVADSAATAIEQAGLVKPDVALLDVRMPGGGPRAAEGIRSVSPGTRSLALSAHDDRSSVLAMFTAGAVGYVTKGDVPVELVEAIRRAARGESSLSSAMLRELVGVVAEADIGRSDSGEGIRSGEVRFQALVESGPDEVTVADGEIVLANGDARAASIREGNRREVAVFIDGVTSVDAHDESVRTISERRAGLERLLAAGENERRRIAIDIHDDSIQVMTAVGMRLEILRRLLSDPAQLLRMDELESAIRLSISRLRRLIFDLRPPMLDDDGLRAALRSYVDAFGGNSDTVYTVEDRLRSEPSLQARLVLYRIAQEALSNVRKHADATQCHVTLASTSRGIAITISDDGVGFVPDPDFSRPGHVGLAAIRERAELADGGLRVRSAPGAGTTVDAWITELPLTGGVASDAA